MQTLPLSPPLPWTPAGDLEVLTFAMGDEIFALEAVLVREILDLLPETAVPGADPLVAHVINFRGRVIPLADPRPAFGMERAAATRDSRIVVIELPIGDDAQLIGLKADRVEEVATLRAGAFEAPPAIGLRWPRGHIRGLVRRADAVVVLPDLTSLFRTLVERAGDHLTH